MDVVPHQFSIPMGLPVSHQLSQQQHHHQLQSNQHSMHNSMQNQGMQDPDKVPQQQSVIQSSQQLGQSTPHLTQQLQTMHDGDLGGDDESKKRRDILTRRPSYRKILNDLSSDTSVKMEGYDGSHHNTSRNSSGTNSPDVNDGEGNDLTLNDDAISMVQGPPSSHGYTLPENSYTIQLNGGTPQGSPSPSVVQLGTPQVDAPQYILNNGNKIQAYTIKGQLPGMMNNNPIGSPQMLAEEATRKRELRLYKNREAARECRRKKKEYVKCLENRVAVLENQNKALIEELKSLKDLYCSKGEM